MFTRLWKGQELRAPQTELIGLRISLKSRKREEQRLLRLHLGKCSRSEVLRERMLDLQHPGADRCVCAPAEGGSDGRMGGWADGRRDDHRVEGGGRGNRWSPVATQDPIKRDGKMADPLLGRPRTDRKKGGGAKLATVGGHAVTFSQVVALQCLMRTPWPLPGGAVGGEVSCP